MYNKNLGNWKIFPLKSGLFLQHLAQLTKFFYMADATVGFNDASTTYQVCNSLIAERQL
jgi:hypothetical protein